MALFREGNEPGINYESKKARIEQEFDEKADELGVDQDKIIEESPIKAGKKLTRHDVYVRGAELDDEQTTQRKDLTERGIPTILKDGCYVIEKDGYGKYKAGEPVLNGLTEKEKNILSLFARQEQIARDRQEAIERLEQDEK